MDSDSRMASRRRTTPLKAPPSLPYPDYAYDPETGTGELREGFAYLTDVHGCNVHTEFITLHPDGLLEIDAGYVWDFGTGAVDTPDMVAASLVHDAGCDLTNEGVIPWAFRREFDREFRRVLAEYGTPLPRRWWCWAVVRINSILLASPPS